MELKEMIMEEFKKEGLELAEESVRAACKACFRIIPKVVIASENKYDDLLLAVLPVIEPAIDKLIDDINKADNEPEA